MSKNEVLKCSKKHTMEYIYSCNPKSYRADKDHTDTYRIVQSVTFVKSGKSVVGTDYQQRIIKMSMKF